MRRNLAFGLCLAFALGTAGCGDQRTAPTAPSAGTGTELDQPTIKLDRNHLRLPPSGRLADGYFGDVARRAIDPDDYVCDDSTPVINWFIGETDKVDANTLDLLFALAADVVPTVDALLFQTEATPQTFGYNGEYNKVMAKTDRDVKRFWDIASDDIQLIGMHGTMLLDVDRVATVYEAAFVDDDGNPISRDDAVFFATLVRDAVLQSQALNGGNHPLFSFNAFAFTTLGGPIPDKIVMGDGILAGYKAVGLDDVAPQAVYAHEFGHHIQFENGYFDDPVPGATTQAELTRYTELMADAFSAYYLTHKRGAGMKRQRVEQFLQVFFQIGDCAFSNPGHHGTPNQRMAAARFGFDVADQARKNGHILTSEQFHALFVAKYQELVAPDAPNAAA
jgi:hypothetical protein